jgi:hypothetical protein
MEEKENLFENLFDKAEEYGKVSFELLKLKTIDKTSEVISSLLSGIIIMMFFCMFFVFLNIGIALWIGEALDKTWCGFVILAAFYVILTIILNYFVRDKMKRFFSNLIIRIILD